MGRKSVPVRLVFVKIPPTNENRIFRDAISVSSDFDENCFQDLGVMIENKLIFMEYPRSTNFIVFHTVDGDRVVVDEAYYRTLTVDWVAQLFRPKIGTRRPRQRSLDLLGVDEGQGATAETADRRGAAGHGPTYTPRRGTSVDAYAREDSGDDDGEEVAGGGGVSALPGSPPMAPVTLEVEIQLPRLPQLASTAVNSLVPSPADTTAPLTLANLARIKESSANPVPLLLSTNAQVEGATAPAPTVPAGAATRDLSRTAPTATSPTVAPPVVRVAALACPPSPASFMLRCVVVAVRVREPRPGMTVAEVDLCDATPPHVCISAMSFDAAVVKAVTENLRSDRRQVVELRDVHVRRKTAMDARFQTNPHPLMLRLDAHSKIEVVQILAVPLLLSPHAHFGASAGAGATATHSGSSASHAAGASARIVTVREATKQTGVLDISSRPTGAAQPPLASSHSSERLLQTSSSSSSPPSTGSGVPGRRTMYCLTSTGGTRVQPALMMPSPACMSHRLQQQQERYLQSSTSGQQLTDGNGSGTAAYASGALHHEPGVAHVTAEELRRRDALLHRYASAEEQRRERLRRRKEVSHVCAICGLDVSSGDPAAEAETLKVVRRLCEANSRNRGKHIPDLGELRRALADQRDRKHQPSSAIHHNLAVLSGADDDSSQTTELRLECATHVVNVAGRRVQVVHPRCAHLCTSYQRGETLENVVAMELDSSLCTLCGEPGATVRCYHPDCSEMFHVVCALFSNGYVNMGKQEPLLPCPACPRHTLVSVDQNVHRAGKSSKTSRTGDTENPLHGGGGGVGRMGALQYKSISKENLWSESDAEIAFDSRIVNDGDLRDPDENDGY